MFGFLEFGLMSFEMIFEVWFLWFGLVFVLFGVVCFVGKVIIVKFVYCYGVDVVILIMFCMLFVLLLFFVLLVWVG